MPWCPVCKNEYKEGILRCSDCQVTLVDTLEEESRSPVMFGGKAQMERLAAFLEYSGIAGAAVEQDEAEDVYECVVRPADETAAKKLAGTFLAQEGERELLSMDEEERRALYEEQAAAREAVHGGVYQKKVEKAEDFRSSAYTLLPVGVLGLLAVAGVAAGIIPLRLADNVRYIFYLVMSALFIAFIAVGISSLKLSKKLAADGKTEEAETERLMRWFTDSFTAVSLDERLAQALVGEPDEVKYFKRFELIKRLLSEHMPQAAENYLEKVADDLYQQLYGEA